MFWFLEKSYVLKEQTKKETLTEYRSEMKYNKT